MSNYELTGDFVIQQAILGDSDAFSTLYDAYAGKVYRHVSYKVPNLEDAQDITQEVFIRAWRAVGRYQIGKTPFFSWLLVIAKNLIADFYRIRHDHAILDTMYSHPGNIDIEKEVETNLKKSEVHEALSRLKKHKRTVLVLRYIDGLSYPEIGQTIGKNEGAVRVLVHRALSDLKNIVDSSPVLQSN